MSEWRPVETAPKDGTPILGAALYGPDDGSIYVCWWESGDFTSSEQDGWIYGLMDNDHHFITVAVTHWMPLPELPQVEAFN